MLRSRGSSETRPGKPFGESRSWMARNRARQAVGLVAGIVLLTFSAAAFSDHNDNYTYDTLGRLIKVVYVEDGKVTTVTYSYDAAGNRTSVVIISPS